MNKLAEKLKAGIVIFDGAMGTEIYKHNFFVNTSFDSLSLTAPQVIASIHQAYVDAGADIMTTNTFCANRARLNRFGLGDQMVQINEAGVRLARAACGENGLVAGSVGPVNDIVSLESDPMASSITLLSEHVQILAKAGVDFIHFETFASLTGIQAALQTMTAFPEVPFVLSITLERSGDTQYGESLFQVMKIITDAQIQPTALGLNCGEGPEGTLSALEKVFPLTALPLIIQPNAGMPKNVDGRMIYMTSPEYFATYAMRYVTLGAQGVGGCCGTGPDHIREVARTVRPFQKSQVKGHLFAATATPELEKTPIPLAEKSQLGAKLATGKWVTSVEITPPRGFDLTSTIQKAIRCREAGVDAINLPDGPRASSRLSPLVAAIEIQRQAGIEAVLHCCCRDKNLIGMQADLLGCAAVGVNNILFITGDPPKLGDYPFASAVFDVDSIGMVKIQSRLNRGLDIGSKSIDAPMRTVIGVGTDPNALDLEREIRRLHEKIEAGAEFIMTQPVFDPESLKRFLESAKVTLPVLAGVWPLASYRNAEFMKNEVPGVVVPDSVMIRMGKAESKEAQREAGIAIAREAVAAIRGIVQGVQVSAPFGNVETALAVLQG